MSSLFSSIRKWFTGEPDVPELPPNILSERDFTPDNNFWISCLLDPTLEIKYVNGVVTKILDTDKCVIDGKYQYQPKNQREIRNFLYIEINSPVRISLYRKKNSDAQWNVASCFLNKNDHFHQSTKVRENETVQVHLEENKPTVHVNDNNENNEEDILTVEVIGDMPKIIGFEQESTFQIILRNNSYIKEKKLLDYRTMQGHIVQLSINNKTELPLVIGILSYYVFDITLKGKYLGTSTEKVEFIFDDITYKVGVNIDVIDPRIAVSNHAGFYARKEIDMQRLFELQNDSIVPGVRCGRRSQFTAVKLNNWNIPSQLTKCFFEECGNLNTYNCSDIKKSIQQLYPATFEVLTYQNYKAKFHLLLFIEEIEISIALQKYSKDRIHFEHSGEYLVLKIPDLSEQRPSLIAGDRVIVTDPPNCTKRLGESGKYEGIIHRVLAEEIWLKFDPEFHSVCGHWDYSLNFFHARISFRKQHHIIDELWKKPRLGEEFLFPYKDTIDYKPPKLVILDQINAEASCEDKKINMENKIEKELKPKVVQQIIWFNSKLNPEQKSAVINILKGEARPMPYVIYGPPGTGKTVTLTEAIIQVYKEFSQSKLLICAPTNSAVDMLLGKLINSGLFNKNIMKRLVGYNHFISTSYDTNYDEYYVLPVLENSHLTPDESNLKFIQKRDILKLRIVITTEGTAGLLYMMGIKSGTFTHIFIDEAGQSKEPEMLLPLSFLDKYRDGQVVLAGDPKQLGPVLLSTIARSSGLGQSMMSRFINYPSYQRDNILYSEHNGYNPKVITHLIRNYRSLPQIVQTYSNFFYNSLLLPTKLDNDVPERVFLNNLSENVHWDIGCKGPTIVHGIVGEDCQEPSSPSWFNPHEAFQVLLYTTRLMKAGISTSDIGIITPYSSQVTKIIELLKMYHSDIDIPKVGTVEMFQGQERLIIIMSIVRSKSSDGRDKDRKFNLGFLVAKERVNVALSRAKALLIIIGDPSTMLRSSYFKSVLLNAIKNNNYVGCNVPEKSDGTIQVLK